MTENNADDFRDHVAIKWCKFVFSEIEYLKDLTFEKVTKNQLLKLAGIDFEEENGENDKKNKKFIRKMKQYFGIAQATISLQVADEVKGALDGLPPEWSTPQSVHQAPVEVASDQYQKFWSSLTRIASAPAKNLLSYDGENIDMDFNEAGIFVRNCYCKIWSSIQVRLRTTKFRTFLITGTPGVGKSISAVFFLWKLARLEKEIVFCRKGEFCLKFSGTSVSLLRWDDVVALGADVDEGAHSRWFIVDANHSDHIPVVMKSYMILICSPKRSTYKEKLKGKTKPYCMPLWSEEELLKCNLLLKTGLSDDTIRERIRKVGLIARYVLDTDKEAFDKGWDDCKQGIPDVTVSHLEIGNTRVVTSIHSISHRIFHLTASQDGVFQCLDFASPELKVRACAHVLETERITALRFLMNSKNKDSVLRGRLFEQVVHEHFRNMNSSQDFNCKNLEDEIAHVHPLSISFSGSASVSSVDALQPKSGVYYVPTSAIFPAVDAMSKGRVFQMTVGLKHGIDAAGEETVLDVFKDDNGELMHCFVVPSDIFRDFRKQNFTRNDKNLPKRSRADKQLHKKLDAVKQCVMEFPIKVEESSKRSSDEISHIDEQQTKRSRTGD